MVMQKNQKFYEKPSQQSQIKQKIVESYFSAWSKVIENHWDKSIPIAYVDLFCGPGVYKDGTPSVPIRLINYITKSETLSKRMIMAFNDRNEKVLRP